MIQSCVVLPISMLNTICAFNGGYATRRTKGNQILCFLILATTRVRFGTSLSMIPYVSSERHHADHVSWSLASPGWGLACSNVESYWFPETETWGRVLFVAATWMGEKAEISMSVVSSGRCHVQYCSDWELATFSAYLKRQPSWSAITASIAWQKHSNSHHHPPTKYIAAGPCVSL